MTRRNNLQIGVIGLGDLGKRLSAQILSSGYKARVFSRRLKNNPNIDLQEAIDPKVDTKALDTPLIKESMSAILEKCDIVHWAAPSNKLEHLPKVPSKCNLVLHDSIMANSKAAITKREDQDQFVICHCLMNDSRRVLVSNEFGNYELANKHLEEIGLSPKYTTIKQHDNLMAYTQGVFALMIESGIKTKLDNAFEEGDLTPSATELREALMKRESSWTEQTLRSILNNPELKNFIKKLSESL